MVLAAVTAKVVVSSPRAVTRVCGVVMTAVCTVTVVDAFALLVRLNGLHALISHVDLLGVLSMLSLSP